MEIVTGISLLDEAGIKEFEEIIKDVFNKNNVCVLDMNDNIIGQAKIKQKKKNETTYELIWDINKLHNLSKDKVYFKFNGISFDKYVEMTNEIIKTPHTCFLKKE
ncbi:hypothetical protein M0Q97_12510 [Candidatus Dojkabacteria bacterium]|jgi:inorganic pyrophosphatase|nr:hypothetical protein [Candidatus Dojkabacteria bacterium]